MYISKCALTSRFFYLFTLLFIYLLHHPIVLLQVWIMIRACRIKLNPRPLGVVHPLGLVIRQEYLVRARTRTNYQAVTHAPQPYSPRKWGASSKMRVDGRDSEAKEGQEWSHLDMINTETELNLSDTTGLCCKLQQAWAHLHQVIEEGVLPTHILQSLWCVPAFVHASVCMWIGLIDLTHRQTTDISNLHHHLPRKEYNSGDTDNSTHYNFRKTH